MTTRRYRRYIVDEGIPEGLWPMILTRRRYLLFIVYNIKGDPIPDPVPRNNFSRKTGGRKISKKGIFTRYEKHWFIRVSDIRVITYETFKEHFKMHFPTMSRLSDSKSVFEGRGEGGRTLRTRRIVSSTDFARFTSSIRFLLTARAGIMCSRNIKPLGNQR